MTENAIKNNGIGISIYRANTNFIEQFNFIDNNQVVASELYALTWGYGYSLKSWKENY